MSDVNLFSSKTDVKKLLFTTDKFKFDEQRSNDSWQDLPGVTPTSVLPSLIDQQAFQTSSISSLSDNRHEVDWETLDEYATVPVSVGATGQAVQKKPTSYCRLDRRGHWLLLPPDALPQKEAPNVVTCHEKKRVLKDGPAKQPAAEIFPDSCESLTVSIDLHVPTDELFTDNDETHGQRQRKVRQYQNIPSDEMRRISR